MAEHFGSLYTMVDYESKVHNLYLSTSFRPTDKMSLFGKVNYNKAESSMDQINMPDGVVPVGELVDMDYDFTAANSYSDFDYTYMTFAGGLKYKLTPTVTYTLDGSYTDLTDDQGYVFGVESGAYYMLRSGFNISF